MKSLPKPIRCSLCSEVLYASLILLEELSGLERIDSFEGGYDQTLIPLISVIEGLMRYQPSGRITASQALRVLRPK